MTICNMTIEGGGRAGMVAPDDTTFAWVEGRPRRPRRLRRRRRRAGASCAPTPARRSTARSTSTRPRCRPQVTWGTNPGDGRRRSPSAVPRAAGRAATSARCSYMALEPGTPIAGDPLDRVFIGSCTNSPHRRPARRRRGRQGPQGGRRRRRDGRPGLPAGASAQAEAEGLDEVFRAAGFDWRSAGCSMCLGMNPDIARAGRALRLDLEPQLRGAPGPRRPHAPRLARRWPPRRRSRATSSTSGSGSADGARREDRRPGLASSTATTSTPTRSSPSSSSSGWSAPASASSCSTTGRKEPGWDLPANPILVTGPQLRLRLLARARAVGARGLRLQGDRRAELRRHLLLQLHEDRAAAGRAARGRRRALMEARRGRGRPRGPGGALRRARRRASRSTPRSSTACSTASTTSR